jgi:N,N'-diacetyl-8-epilegionaminate cytidylyltransferase
MMDEPLNIVAFIFARGGSKGVLHKNIRPVGGVPMIGRAIKVAQMIPRIKRIIISTDDDRIADVARAFGAEVPFTRPVELASDRAAELDAWRHAVSWVRNADGPDAIDVFVSLPATAPLRTTDDVERCIDALLEPPEADIVISVTQARRSPYFNMVRLDENGFARLAAETKGAPIRRQDAPKLYDMTTVAYVARPDFVMNCRGLFEGRVKAVTVDAHSAIDIDTEFDLAVADLVATKESEQQ